MAEDNLRILYQLSQAESTLWQRGGPAAIAFQQQLAELHRQGSLGLQPLLEVVHPDGILAAHHLQEPSVPAQTAVFSVAHGQEAQPAQERGATSTRDLGQAEGTLIETNTVTAYQMSARESAAWSRGDHEASMVSATIGDALKDVTSTQPIAVLLDDGRSAWTQNESLFQTLTASLSLLQDRANAIASGVQVHLDVSVHLGTPRSPSQEALATLQQRADQLTERTPQRTQSQERSY